MTLFILNEEIKSLNDFKNLIKKNKNVLKTKFLYNNYEINIYLYIAMHGTPDMLTYLEMFDAHIIYSVDLDGNHAHILAASSGNLDVVKYLDNRHNFDINFKNNNGENAYLCAAGHGQLDIIKHFFKYHTILKKKRLEILQSLVIIFMISICLCYGIWLVNKQLYKINIVFELWFKIISCVLTTICIFHIIDLIKQLFQFYSKYKINYFINNYDGYNIYFCALVNGHLEIMKYLEKKTKYNWNILFFTNYIQYDAYLLAIKYGYLNIIKHLEKKYKWDITTKDRYGNDAYLLAAQYGHLHIIKYLEQTHNWSPNVKNNKGNNPYLIAIKYAKFQVIEYLEQKRSWSINFTNNVGNNAYIIACYIHNLEVMKYLDQKHNFNIHHKNNNGIDVYLMAINCQYLKIMKYLDDFHKWKRHDYESDNTEISKYLKKFKIKNRIKVSNNINETCIICLEDFIKNEQICKCTNGHIFHINCFENIKNKQECFLCRKNNIITEYYFLF